MDAKDRKKMLWTRLNKKIIWKSKNKKKRKKNIVHIPHLPFKVFQTLCIRGLAGPARLNPYYHAITYLPNKYAFYTRNSGEVRTIIQNIITAQIKSDLIGAYMEAKKLESKHIISNIQPKYLQTIVQHSL